MSNVYKVKSAVYGGVDNQLPNMSKAADVSAVLQQHLDNEHVKLCISNGVPSPNPGLDPYPPFNDPAVGYGKGFAAVVEINNVEHYFACAEGGTIDFSEFPEKPSNKLNNLKLENTTWTYPTGSGPNTTLVFGKNENASGNPGGYGTSTVNYPNAGSIVNEFMWVEDGKGRFMYQIKGPTDKGNNELPTVSGTYKGNGAIGWGTNFDAVWGTWEVVMTKQS